MKLVNIYNEHGDFLICINVDSYQTFNKGDILAVDGYLYKIKKITHVINNDIYDRKISEIQLQVKDVS